MNRTLANILVVAAKQAVNAAVISIAPIIKDPHDYNLTTLHGLGNVGFIVLCAVAAREALVWGPVILKWSQNNATPDVAIALDRAVKKP
jgi:hypothetical protein